MSDDRGPSGGEEGAISRAPGGVGPSPSTSIPGRRLLIAAMSWAVVASVVSWGIGESKLLHSRAEIVKFRAAFGQIEWSTPETKAAAEQRTLARLNAIFGGLLGAGLGVVGAALRRSARSAIGAALLGAGLGAALGGGCGHGLVPLYERYRQVYGGDLPASMALHVGLWAGLGAAAGLALGVGIGGIRRGLLAMVGGLAGAVAGALLYDILGALAFPLDETGLPASITARTRLLARLLVGLTTAAFAALAVGQSSANVGTTDRR